MMAKNVVLTIFVAIGLLVAGISASSADGRSASKATMKDQAKAKAVAPPACEVGRYWCSKQADCIKIGKPCRLMLNDFAF